MTTVSMLFAMAQEDLESHRSNAANGDLRFPLGLALHYRDGKGLAKDNAEAMKWALLAEDDGKVEAIDFVGSAFLRGAVVECNPVIALAGYPADLTNETRHSNRRQLPARASDSAVRGCWIRAFGAAQYPLDRDG
jgi:hypothetical protein